MQNLDQRQAEAIVMSSPIALETPPRVQWVNLGDIQKMNELKARLKHMKPAVKIGATIRLLDLPLVSQ